MMPSSLTLLSAGQVCEALGFEQETLEALIRDGKFPPPILTSARTKRWQEMDVAAYVHMLNRLPKSAPGAKTGNRAKGEPSEGEES